MLGIAGGGIKQERTTTGNNTKNDVWLGTADISLMFGGASLFAPPEFHPIRLDRFTLSA